MSASPFTPPAWRISTGCRGSRARPPIEDIDEPGGGKRVRLTDPDGYQVEVIHGMAMLDPIPLSRPAVNSGNDKLRRKGELFRIERGPSHIKRFGHFVIMSKNFEKTLGWYREMLGFRCSDEVYEGEKSNVVGSFNRLDRGEDYVDHHAFFCIRGDKSGLNHLSFEAADIDDIMVGHEHLQDEGLPAHVGHRPPSASAASSSTTGPIPGAACTSTGPTPTC